MSGSWDNRYSLTTPPCREYCRHRHNLILPPDQFQQLFADSPLVLSKGQANYETMDDQGEKVFFLLRTKCPLLSRRLDVPLGSLVLKQGAPLN